MDVCAVLQLIQRGEEGATERLFSLVYDELRRMAASKLLHERAGHTLQPTALVHEAFLRLVDVEKAQTWNSKSHFFAAASEAMRRILVDHARRRQRQKRGGGLQRHNLSSFQETSSDQFDDLLALDEALNRLAMDEPLAARLIQLRFFVGLTSKEAAELLEISPRTADRVWQFARAWLFREINGTSESKS